MPILTKFCKQGTTHYLWTQRVWIFISLSTLSTPIILSLSIYLLSLSLLSSDYNVSRITELSFLTLKYCQNIFLCSSKNVSVKIVKDIYIHVKLYMYIYHKLLTTRIPRVFAILPDSLLDCRCEENASNSYDCKFFRKLLT